MRVIIAGSRGITNYKIIREGGLDVFRTLKSEGYNTDKSNVEVVSGGARGVDELGEDFAKEFGLGLIIMRADWDNYGKSAGYRRNAEMGEYAKNAEDLGVLIAFWDRKSRGTKHMIDIAKRLELKIFVFDEFGKEVSIYK